MSTVRNSDAESTESGERAESTSSSPVLGRFRDVELAREAGRKSGQARREKAELRAQAPRDVAAAVLMRRAETWAAAVEKQLDAAAGGDTKAFQALLRLIPESFGKVGDAESDAHEDAATLTIEQRQRLKALLLSDAVEGDEENVPTGNVVPPSLDSIDSTP